MNDLVLQTEELSDGPADWLGQRCRLVRCSHDDPRFPALLKEASGLVVRTYTKVDSAMLAAAPRLRVVGRAGVGIENIDVRACRERAVEVVYTPDANSRAVVEFVAALMLDALRTRETLKAPVERDAWAAMRTRLSHNRQLSGLTLGILGLGRIGSEVARLGSALNMRVLYHDIRERPHPVRHGAEPVTFDELMRACEVLTLHVDSRPSNRGLIGIRSLAHARDDLVLINTSRGFVVNAVEVATWMTAHPRAKAMLDVHDPFEPIGPDYPLLGIANVFLTPHIAAGTREAKENMSWVVRDVWRVLSGEPAEFPAPVPHES